MPGSHKAIAALAGQGRKAHSPTSPTTTATTCRVKGDRMAKRNDEYLELAIIDLEQ
jgi:hypothetical protein